MILAEYKKFDAWLKDKPEYMCIKDFLCMVRVSGKNGLKLSMTPNSMVGYMIDYLFEKNPTVLDRPVFWDLFRGENKSIEGLFNWLDRKIGLMEEIND